MAGVGVVVINHGSSAENKMMIRCFSMLMRQKFSELEVYFMQEEESDPISLFESRNDIHEVERSRSFGEYLFHVMEQTKEDYIIFINPAFIMAPNVIGNLVEALVHTDDSDIAFSVVDHFVSMKGKELPGMENSLYGKLFSAEWIRQLIAKNKDEFCSFSEFSFWLESIQEENKSVIAEKTYIYGDRVPLPIEGIQHDCDYHWISLLSQFSEDDKIRLIEDVISRIDNTEVTLRIIENLARVFPDDNRVQLHVSKKYVKQYYQAALSGDESAYLTCKEYIKALSVKPELVRVLIAEIGISQEQKELMDRYDFKDYHFFYNRIPNKLETEINEIDVKRLESLLEMQINKLNTLPVKSDFEKIVPLLESMIRENLTVCQSTNLVEPAADPVGPALADYTVKQYSEGKLGFKTILASMKAWLKYKL